MTISRIEGLDGLRAFAVLVVLGYHLWPTAMPGGFIGVDVFFVISGFLITTLLLREHDKNGHINLSNFWLRRARRLLPALCLVVTSSIGVAWLVNSELLVNIKRQTLGALTFSTNWVEIFAGTDYFAGADQALFITFWSLAVEEQFYLLWPLILVISLKMVLSRTKLALGALIAAAASALFMAFLFNPAVSVTRIYYGTDTHCFGLMIGVAVAFAISGDPKMLRNHVWQRLRPVLGFSAIVTLTVLVMYIDSNAAFTYRGGIVLASVLSAVALAALPGPAIIFTTFCRLHPIAWVGERSYGLYLWHWPVLMICGAAKSMVLANAPDSTLVLPVIAFTFLLTEASYRWIEAPVRSNGFGATLSALALKFRDQDGWRRWPDLAMVFTAALFITACVGLLNAPVKSQEQLAVEAGEHAIAEKNANRKADEQLKVSQASENPAWPRDFPLPAGDSISAFGDSVMSGSAPALYARFPGIYINAKPSMQWHDAPNILQPLIEKGTMRRFVILNYGTNAGFKEPESEQALRQILEALGPKRRVVLVNTVGYSYWVPSTNETLQRISAEYPNTVVADWWSVANKRRDLLHRDKTHPNDEGTAVYINVIAEALERLGPG